MTPEAVREWWGIVRDLLVFGLGAFIIIFQVLSTREPNPYLIGAALTLVGIPAAVRIDKVRRRAERVADDVEDANV